MEANETTTTTGQDLRHLAQAQLEGKRGQRYWRSLEELSDTPEFQQFMDDEFPNRSTLLQINRRDLMKFMGASIALAGLSGCRGVFLPQDKVVPYVKQPEELVPGKALYYATAIAHAGYATGVLVEQQEGRPIKIEGNSEHPASLGALDSITQAQILSFYDPDRVGTVLNRFNVGAEPDPSTWELYEKTQTEVLKRQFASGGEGIRILTGSTSSPTLVAQLKRVLTRYPKAKWHTYEPTGRSNSIAASTAVLGKPLDAIFDFTTAKVVVSIDSDFLSPATTPGSLRYAREFAAGRRVKGKHGEMNRLYAVESTPGIVGAIADHRWPVRASEVYSNVLALANALGVAGVPAGEAVGISESELKAMAGDLLANRGTSIVIAGEHQPASVHSVVLAINEFLGNFDKTVKFIEPVDATVTAGTGDLASLVSDLNAGGVELLLILEGNPVYDAPVDLKFSEALGKAKVKVHAGQYDDETSHWCDWHLPITHPLEMWNDLRAFDGTLSIAQPLMAPLYEGKNPIEIIAMLVGDARSSYDLIQETWSKGKVFKSDFEKGWRRTIHDGLLADSASASVTATVNLASASLPAPVKANGMEIAFLPDPYIFDGRYANNGWLQELPKPLTKLTWDNVAMISPATAKSLGLNSDDLIQVKLSGGRELNLPVFLQPGQPADQVTVHLGYGRTRGGMVAVCVASENDNTGKSKEDPTQHGGTGGGGFNAYALRTSAAPYIESGLEIQKVGNEFYHLATTQGHQPINGDRIEQFPGDRREVVIEHDLRTFNEEAGKIKEERDEEYAKINKANLYPEEIFVYDGPQWGMTIDLNTCIGCNACVTACQAENNIPVVGKEQVARHREMHWIRIDRYYSGDDANPQVAWQPVACVHCEKAPCEPVCPVAATIHSHEGLNQMVYNRCVGTRYCSNNCPYKVRRFNYLNYTDNQKQFDSKLDEKPRIPLLRMLNNPNVTVRGRGIMEKCTYCVQRINSARIEAKKQNRDPKDGEIITACQQACPTQTIVFGNIADRESEVSQWRNDERAYLLLQELQTRPRTTHLAKLRNPNPEITPAPTTEASKPEAEGGH